MSQGIFGNLMKPVDFWEYHVPMHIIKIYRITEYTNYIKNSIKILKTQIDNLAIHVLLY